MKACITVLHCTTVLQRVLATPFFLKHGMTYRYDILTFLEKEKKRRRGNTV